MNACEEKVEKRGGQFPGSIPKERVVLSRASYWGRTMEKIKVQGGRSRGEGEGK